MRCICNAHTSVLETRGQERRRECFNLHRFTTVEVDLEALQYELRQRTIRAERAKIKLRHMGWLR